jgi:predicted HicB family RNase H-like nuclease
MVGMIVNRFSNAVHIYLRLKYKTYTAEITFSALTYCFYGEVIDLKSDYNDKSTIIFLSSNSHTLQAAFQQAVDQYLQFMS